MEMRRAAARVAGVPYCSNGLPAPHVRTNFDELCVEVRVVQRFPAQRADFPDDVAAETVRADRCHDAIRRRDDGRAARREDVDAFAANRTRMEELVRDVPGLRVLPDDYMVTLQAIVVPKGKSAQLAEINRFLADVRKSGFVRSSLDKAKVAGVKVAPEPRR